MNAKLFLSFTLSLAFGTAVLAAEQGTASGTETSATAAVLATAPAPLEAGQALSTRRVPGHPAARDASPRWPFGAEVTHGKHLDSFDCGCGSERVAD